MGFVWVYRVGTLVVSQLGLAMKQAACIAAAIWKEKCHISLARLPKLVAQNKSDKWPKQFQHFRSKIHGVVTRHVKFINVEGILHRKMS